MSACDHLVAGFLALNKLKNSTDLCSVMGEVFGADKQCGSEDLMNAIDRAALCELFCCCLKNDPHQSCVQDVLFKVEQLSHGVNYYKPEIPYRDKAPVTLKRDDELVSRGRPSGSRIPDVVVVKDPTKLPTLDNVSRVYEMKFPGDDWNPKIGKDGMNQFDSYVENFGDKLDKKELDENSCHCNKKDNDGGEKVLKRAQNWDLATNRPPATVLRVLGAAGRAHPVGRLLGILGGLAGAF